MPDRQQKRQAPSPERPRHAHAWNPRDSRASSNSIDRELEKYSVSVAGGGAARRARGGGGGAGRAGRAVVVAAPGGATSTGGRQYSCSRRQTVQPRLGAGFQNRDKARKGTRRNKRSVLRRLRGFNHIHLIPEDPLAPPRCKLLYPPHCSSIFQLTLTLCWGLLRS